MVTGSDFCPPTPSFTFIYTYSSYHKPLTANGLRAILAATSGQWARTKTNSNSKGRCDMEQIIKQFEQWIGSIVTKQVQAYLESNGTAAGLTEDAVRDIAREEADEALSNATFETTVN